MTVSIIIPNYNGAALLKKNLPAVQKAVETYKNRSGNTVEIIVTDDGSRDESKSVVATVAPGALFLDHSKNTGFAANVNRGVKKATGEVIVLLNTDVTPEENFLIPLVRHFTADSVFAVGCKERNHERKEKGRGVGKWEKGFLVHSAGDVTKDDTLWASGGSSAFRKSDWEKLGGLYEVYDPFYWEDIDLSYRALKAGKQVVFEPDSVVTHAHDEGSIRKQFSKKTVTATAYRNQFLFVWINITESNLVLSHLLWLPVHIIQAGLRGDGAFFSGLLQAIARLPRALMLRGKNRGVFTVNDLEILKRFV